MNPHAHPSVAHALATARRLITMALTDERQRLDDQRSTPRGGRRSTDETMYRVLFGAHRGQIVPESETVICDEAFDGCDGSGVISVRYSGDHGGFDSYVDGERDCDECGGVGRVLGYTDRGATRLAVVGSHADKVWGARTADHTYRDVSGSVDGGGR